MGKNIRNLLRTAVFNAFSENRDKHSLIKEGTGADLIYSYGSRNQLLDRINDFCKTLPPEIKKIEDIKQEHLQGYLASKAGICTQRSLDEYRAQLRKIGKITGTGWMPTKVESLKAGPITSRGAKDVISKEDWQKVLEYCEAHLDVASCAVIALEKYLGVRVSDICYGIKDKGNKLDIISKNGKKLTVPVTAEMRSFLSKPEIQKLFIGENFKPCKDNSVNKQLSRIEDKLGIEKHSFHAIRRRIAQDKYDALRMSGVSRKEALSIVSLGLNHGKQRDSMIVKSYISDAL